MSISGAEVRFFKGFVALVWIHTESYFLDVSKSFAFPNVVVRVMIPDMTPY